MEQILKSLLAEIDKAYLLAGQELLETKRLYDIGTNIRGGLHDVLENIDDEILSLQFKKLNSGLRNVPKSGFVGISIAHSELEVWRIFISEILNLLKASAKTFKNRLEAEGLFVEVRSKEGDDMHLIIGQRDGAPDKAHVVLDEKTGEIRVEDNQVEPLELVKKIESIVTLQSGKRIKVTREAIEELTEQ
ncbi:MAG: hypothetical protein RLY47_601 [Candidatus Parcubacteria bacterium]|jgi:hypothetical protein